MIKKILVVDDNTSSHWIYRRKLGKLRAALRFAASTDEAIGYLTRSNYDIIIIQDYDTRVYNGPDFYDELRNHGYTGPVLVLTSNPKAERSTYNGVLDLVHRSISGRKLCDLLTERLKQSKQVKQNNSITEGM